MDDLLAGLADFLEKDPTYASPGELAKAIYPATVQTAALDAIDAALTDVAEGRCKRLMVFMPPQEGKSERVSHYFPLWMLQKNPDTRIAIASYDLSTAERWGRDIRTDIQTHDGEDGNLDLGLRLRKGSSAAGRWQLDGHRGGVYCVGIDGALTGRPVDLLIIDDPVKNRREADSAALREVAWSFWTSSARTRLAPNAPVVVIQTRWHEDDLSGRLLAQAAEDPEISQWRVINIPAQAEENDYLGRKAGEWLTSARKGRNAHDNAVWKETKRSVGSRDWVALYQQRPAPAEGNIFKREWWRTYDIPRAVRQGDGSMRVLTQGQVIQSWDMTYKDSDGSDFVVGQVWLKNGLDVTLLDQVRDRMSFSETVAAVRRLSAKWPQARLKLIEDKANGPAVISELKKEIGGIVPYTPQGSKLARAQAVAPFAEAGQVWLPSPRIAPWVGEFIDELAGFPNSSHDDQVDAFSQALTRLLLEAGGAHTFMESLLRDRGVTMLRRRDVS